jgi:hypothetical protein
LKNLFSKRSSDFVGACGAGYKDLGERYRLLEAHRKAEPPEK